MLQVAHCSRKSLPGDSADSLSGTPVNDNRLPPPPFMTIRRASKLLRWGWKTTYDWAVKTDIIVQIGDRVFISVYRLKQQNPDVFIEIASEDD